MCIYTCVPYMYMYLYIIYSYIRVPRMLLLVCVVRICYIGRVCPLAQSGLCVLTCCLWKGEKTRSESAESDERKHQTVTRRGD